MFPEELKRAEVLVESAEILLMRAVEILTLANSINTSIAKDLMNRVCVFRNEIAAEQTSISNSTKTVSDGEW